jgi:hypothetical protein
MADVKHTPGPWRVGREEKYHSFVSCRSSEDDLSDRNAGCWVAEAKGPDHEANARLIAAAPELLEALERLVRAASMSNCDSNRIDEARSAIAKTTQP